MRPAGDHARTEDLRRIRIVSAYTVPGVNMSQADIVYPADFDDAVKTVEDIAEAAAATVTKAGVPVSTIVPGDTSGVMVEHSKNAAPAVVGAAVSGFAGRLSIRGPGILRIRSATVVPSTNYPSHADDPAHR